MSTTFTQPPQSKVDYPDDDGQPMSENTLQFKWIVLIKEGLETLFRRDCNVFVAGDLLWYPEEGKEITEMNGHVSRRLEIRFEPGEGPNNLRIIGPDGQPFRTHQELMEQAEAERQRALRLADKLRELGIEPD